MNSIRHATTLRQLAGLTAEPPRLDDALLLVIDAQLAYTEAGDLPLDGVEAATRRIAELLERARRASAPVVHIAHHGADGSPFDPQRGGRFMSQAAPVRSEAVVRKPLPNAFAGTDLLDVIRSASSRPIVLCGFMTHMCVSSTARAALDLGLVTAIASDATATRDLPAANRGDVIPAAAVHEAALAALADRFSVVVSTQQLLDNGSP